MVEEQTPEVRYYTEEEIEGIVEAEIERARAEREGNSQPQSHALAVVPDPQPTTAPSPEPERAMSDDMDELVEQYETALRTLNDPQQRFVLLRSLFPSDVKTCEVVGISRSTLGNWKKQPVFAFCYANRNIDVMAGIRSELTSLVKLATNRHSEMLQNGELDDEVLIRAIAEAYRAVGLGRKPAPQFVQQINVNAGGERDFPAAVINAESAKRGLPPLREE